jgi:hypothetical protein
MPGSVCRCIMITMRLLVSALPHNDFSPGRIGLTPSLHGNSTRLRKPRNSDTHSETFFYRNRLIEQ